MSGSRIVGLDLATTSGIAYGAAGEKPRCATWNLGRGLTRAHSGLNLMRKLLAFIEEYHPDHIFIEEPMHARTMVRMGATVHTQVMLSGLVFMAETVAYSRGVKTTTVPVQTVRKHFVGKAIFKGKDAGKRVVAARCRALGWDFDGFDQADAAATWDYGCAVSAPSYAIIAAERPHTGARA